MDDQPGVDLGVVSRWMDDRDLPPGAIDAVTPIGGGTQNIMLRFRRGEREYVLRRGPKHLRAASNTVIERESTLLGALRGTDVPAPRLIAACTDPGVLDGAVFYLMEPVDGFSPAAELPPLHAGDATVRHAMGLSAVEAIARLGQLDHEAVGLAGFGKPDGFLERQVPRWLRELESYGRNDGYPGPRIPGLDRVAAWLGDNRPEQGRPGILHGDCHLANIMFRRDGPEVAALVDWEMSTIGDPLLDLGWQLATRPSGAFGALVGPLAALGGLPERDAMIAHYARFSDRDLRAVDWYTVLACFKLGIVLEGTHARAFAGKAPQQVGDFLHSLTLHLFEQAVSLI